jgi:hypothetical protein
VWCRLQPAHDLIEVPQREGAGEHDRSVRADLSIYTGGAGIGVTDAEDDRRVAPPLQRNLGYWRIEPVVGGLTFIVLQNEDLCELLQRVQEVVDGFGIVDTAPPVVRSSQDGIDRVSLEPDAFNGIGGEVKQADDSIAGRLRWRPAFAKGSRGRRCIEPRQDGRNCERQRQQDGCAHAHLNVRPVDAAGGTKPARR